MDQLGDENKKSKKQQRKIFAGSVTILLVGFLLGNISARFGVFIGPNASVYSNVVRYADAYNKYAGLFEAREVLMNYYNGDIDDETLLNGAIKGMTSSIQDPYTVYMTKDEYEEFSMSNSGLRIGIGVTIALQDDKVTIVNIETDAPADRAGLAVGDVIDKINGESVNADTSNAVSLIANSESDTMTLTIIRDGESSDVEVTKEEIKTNSVESEMIDDSVGYIRLKDFNEDSSTELIDALSALLDCGMTGLVLDLRDNGGGYLSEAVAIASQFIPEGEVVTTLSNKFGDEKVSKSEGGIAENIPIVILTNGNTASASEVLTGALKDYDIATTVGTNTYGKGVAQSVFGITNTEGAIKVTIDNFYTPSGENINKIGIAPDIEVELTEDSTQFSKDTDAQYLKALEVIRDEIN